MSRLLSKNKRSKKRLSLFLLSEPLTERETPIITNLFKKKSTHTVKFLSKENSHTLMTQMLKLLSKNKRNKKKPLLSHQSEPSTEKETPTTINSVN
jgi:hypothetical protein